jgi:hypothetical protein
MPVTSTSAASGPPLAPGLGLGILDEIKKLFSWNPPYLNSAKTITLTGTRPPPFYNKHFKEELVLQRVERFSSLPNYLKKNVDKALKAALKKSTLPPPLNGFITADQRKNELNVNVVTYMEDERDVANHYFTTTAKYCLTLASTLALHPTTTQWNTLVFWTGSVPNSNYAIAEGQLRFRVDENEYRDAIMECVKSEIHPIVEEMREAKSPLATMEIKSLRAGPVQVMTAVRNLGKFSWTYCDAPNCPDCLESNKHTKALKEVEKVVVGHDAPDPPWKLPVCSYSLNRKTGVHHTLRNVL